MNPIPHYYHCATKGFDHSILFADIREFIAGMNRIGICHAHLKSVIVIAFCLMDNHVHFIFYGTREDCLKWMALYHRLTMIWQGKHRDGNPVDEDWECDAWQIYDSEDLKEKIAYVLRNPTVARMGFVPGGYRWSSAALVFADTSAQTAGARKIGALSIYESRKLFETRTILPEDWIVLPDAEVVRITREQAERMFGTGEIKTLDLASRIQLCQTVRKQSGTSLKQLARIVQLPLADLKKIFG